ncbi:MAG: cobyric acid synthase [Candidatus Binatia bacterium]
MAKALMVLGTASDVGKSVIAAGLCRLLYRRGIRVAPFKAQNMSLNSFVTMEGGEMGRAQVLQAHACGLQPHVDMNPILLKPEADHRSQVIVHGRVWRSCEARSYFELKNELFPFVQASYQRLASTYDVIVIEGAGSAAEVNLREWDLVNWPVAEMANATVMLVADIDRGGVFAQVIGTLDLLTPEERGRVLGVVINRLRGDARLFTDGVTFLEKRTGLPVLGVIPFLRDLELDQEDSLEIERYRHIRFNRKSVNIAVTLLPRMSNFTDFNALAAEPDVALQYVASPFDLVGADVIIVPGSKNTIADLDYLQRHGFSEALKEHVNEGGELVGICGGYQILGREISDPYEAEEGGSRQGLGLLDVFTELLPQKRTVQIEAFPLFFEATPDCTVSGYEIHIGRTRRSDTLPSFRIIKRVGQQDHLSCEMEETEEGAISRDQLVWGTYIHGVFDRPGFRRLWLNRVRQRKSLPPLETLISEVVTARLLSTLDRWADHLQQHLDLGPIFAALDHV